MNSAANFFHLLQYALGNRNDCPVLTLGEWREVYAEAQRQALAAFLGDALSRAGHVLKDIDADSEREFTRLLMQWTAQVMQQSAINRHVSANAVGVAASFWRAGFECCLLKGQGNAMLYPNPDARTAGDIDMWVRPRLEPGQRRRTGSDALSVIAFIRRKLPQAEVVYHHVECPPYHGSPVEAHYRPQFMFSAWHNVRLQRYFLRNADRQFRHKVSLGGGEIAVPTAGFNAVFQLSHIFNHLFHEGIGLRQLVDYYYVVEHLTAEERHEDWPAVLRPLGLLGMAGAVMWILVDRFGMPADRCIVPPDERRGRFVLREIMAGGNFGQYDHRDHFGHGRIGRNAQRLWRDVRLLRLFPSEALSEPLFRLWHFGWRKFIELRI